MRTRVATQAWSGWKVFLLVVLVGGIAGLGGCAEEPRTLVVTVGGAGFSQMHDLREAVERECPEARVISAGMWDAYKTDIRKIVTDKPRDHVILIGHSFGCAAIDEAADELPLVDLAVFIDPAWNDFSLSKRVDEYLWFKRSTFGIEREARIVGASGAKEIEGGHNDIPHSPQLIAEVVAEVRRIAHEEPGGKGKKAPEMANAAEGRNGATP